MNLVRTPGTSRAKIAYLFCRYWPLVTYPITLWVQVLDHDRSLCESIFRIPMFLTIPNLGTAAGVLVLRIYAFTGGKSFVVAFLTLCFVVVAGYQAFVASARAMLIPKGNGCFPVDTGTAKHLSGYFLAALLFDCTVTLTFTIYAARIVKLRYSELSRFTRIFIREGAAYFLAISVINIINAGFNFQPVLPEQTVNVPMSLLLPNLLACRLVLNLRNAVSSGEQSTLNATSGDNIQFNNAVYSNEFALSDMKRTSQRPTSRFSGVKWSQAPSSPMRAEFSPTRYPRVSRNVLPIEEGEDAPTSQKASYTSNDPTLV